MEVFRVQVFVMSILALALALMAPAINAEVPAPAPAPTSDAFLFLMIINYNCYVPILIGDNSGPRNCLFANAAGSSSYLHYSLTLGNPGRPELPAGFIN
ncbi:hypothetical protein SESBI_13918 [Sesbania bispinosa]|nr:hypothetical protein SESBI_13918 [Sesbania bispinosa]